MEFFYKLIPMLIKMLEGVGVQQSGNSVPQQLS